MKFSVPSSSLKSALQRVVAVIPSKTTYPILNDILFQIEDGTLNLTATDLEVSLKTNIAVNVEQKGEIAVPGKILNDTIKMFPDIDITFSLEEERRLQIHTKMGDEIIMRKEYQAVSLQKDLLQRIDNLIDGKGFSSRAEFVRYCVFKELDRRGAA